MSGVESIISRVGKAKIDKCGGKTERLWRYDPLIELLNRTIQREPSKNVRSNYLMLQNKNAKIIVVIRECDAKLSQTFFTKKIYHQFSVPKRKQRGSKNILTTMI